jgi:hypothetical protein
MMEFRSKMVTVTANAAFEGKSDTIERTCNEWAKEGWEVFSIVCPQPSNYSTYRLTAKRDFSKQPFQESLI